MTIKSPITFLTLSVLTFSVPVFAADVHIYKNNSGETLITDQKPKGKDKDQYKHVRTTHSLSQTLNAPPAQFNYTAASVGYVPAERTNTNSTFSSRATAYDAIIRQAARRYQISEGLIKAVMHTESAFNPYARSHAGAQGLMQLMPATARRFGVTNAYDPYQNINAGSRYLSWLLKRFNNNVEFALAGYNAGEGNVDKYRGIPPFRETRNYVRKVLSRYRTLYGGGLVTHSAPVLSGPLAASSTMGQSGSQYATDLGSINRISSNRPIISANDQRYSNAPKTYATENAYISSSIQLLETNQ